MNSPGNTANLPPAGREPRPDQSRTWWVRAICWSLLILAALSILMSVVGAAALGAFLNDNLAALTLAALGLAGLTLAPLLGGANRSRVEFDSRVQVVHAGPGASRLAWLSATERVSRARKSIRVLQSCLPQATPPDERNEGTAILYEAVLERTADAVDYTHIFQAESAEALASVLQDPAVRSHMELAFARRSAGRDDAVARIQLKLAAPRFPFSFIIVDDECIIWQLDERADGNAVRTGGAMVIEGGDGTAVQDFLALFKAVDGRAVLMLENPLRVKSGAAGHTSSRTPGLAAPRAPERVLDWTPPERQSK